jgi:hypothetical protein
MTTATATDTDNWTLLQKIALRFFFLFFVLFIFFDPNGVTPNAKYLSMFYDPMFRSLVPWVGKHMLSITRPVVVMPNGSGDTTYSYVWLFTIFFISFLGMMIWSALDRKTQNYRKLYFWVWVAVRYYVAITMLAYGSFKVVKLQFPYPTPGRLLEPVGNMSPMGLAWTYMGYSAGYNWFTGLGEISCGLLLLFRRTTTLGAVIALAVAGNIMAINYTFDVPVKILSTVLVCMCLFLLLRDYDRLFSFFFKNTDAKPSNIIPPRFRARWKNITLCVFKYILIGYVIISLALSAFQSNKAYGDAAPKPKYYGIYNVQYFIRGHDTLPPLTTDSTRWRRFWVSLYGRAAIGMMNDSIKNYTLHVDTVKHRFVFVTISDIQDTTSLSYKVLKPDTLLLSGLWWKDSIKMKLVKFDMNKFRLNSRGFHWVNEEPFNR